MSLISLFLQVGILWLLITYFSRSKDSNATLRETWIVVFGMLFVGLVSRLLLGELLGVFVGIPSLIALYVLVDKVCGLSRSSTIKVCGIYIMVMVFFGIAGAILSMPVSING